MRHRLRYMRWRIAAAYVLLIILTLTLLSIVRLGSLRSTYLETLEAGIVGQARLVATIADNTRPPIVPSDELDTIVVELSRQLGGARVTLAAADGTPIADSHLALSSLPNLLTRPEVREAASLGHGANTRAIPETGDDTFFVAVLIGDSASPRGFARVGVPLTQVEEAQAHLAVQVFTAALFAIVIALILAVLIAGRMTRPLLQLRLMAARLAAGNLDVQVPIPDDEDVSALAQGFNLMASRLRLLIQTLESERRRLETVLATLADGILMLDPQNVVQLSNRAASELLSLRDGSHQLETLPIYKVLAPAVAEVRSVGPEASPTVVELLLVPGSDRSLRAVLTTLPPPEQDFVLVLLQDLTDLRRAEQIRRIFLTDISHDLRTPLASLQAIVETLQDGALHDQTVAYDFLRRMDLEVQGLNRLVSAFLELSRIESGHVPLHCEEADLNLLLGETLERMQAQAQHKGVQLRLSLPETLPALSVDSTRIEQILLNLLQNALFFTPPGGLITLSAATSPDELTISVSDTGVGISAKDLPHIFERFYKADRARRSSGTGLGLAISKLLVERHNGRIWAESTPQVGTTVHLALPLR